MSELRDWLASDKYRLKPSTILKLNRYALDGLSTYAGVFRPAGVKIFGSGHTPVAAAEVPGAVEEFCDYIHENWHTKTAIHLSAYALWKLNWIHPFVDGNGRTARVVSYLILCARTGARLPGKVTIPEQIALNKAPYYKALEDADSHYRVGKKINVEAMEAMLDAQLASQLLSVHEDATGSNQTRSAVASPPPNETSLFKAATRPTRNAYDFVTLIENHPVVAGGIMLLIATLLGVWLS